MQGLTRVKWRWIVGVSLICVGLFTIPEENWSYGGFTILLGYLFLKGYGED